MSKEEKEHLCVRMNGNRKKSLGDFLHEEGLEKAFFTGKFRKEGIDVRIDSWPTTTYVYINADTPEMMEAAKQFLFRYSYRNPDSALYITPWDQTLLM